MDRQCSSPVDEAVSRHNVTAQHQAMGNTLQTPDRKTNRHELLSAQTSIVSQDSSGESTNSANHSPSNSGGQTSEIKFGNWDKKFLLTLGKS
jgi:hypothetical protein